MAPPVSKIIENPEQFAEMVNSFIADCLSKDIAPYKQRFCLAHGINPEQISRWAKKYKKGSEHDPQGYIGQAIKSLEQANELRLLDKLDKTSSSPNAMFLLKSCHGYIETEKVKHEHSGDVSLCVVSGVPKAGR